MKSESIIVEQPDYSLDLNGNYDRVKDFVTTVFPPSSDIPTLEQLKGGITNVLLKGKIGKVEFLIRAYGKGTGTIINRDREYATHKQLQSLGLAPELYARFANGLVYGFVQGTSIHYTQMSRPEIMKGVSNRLAQWHSLLDSSKIEQHIEKLNGGDKDNYSKDFWQLMEKWIETIPSGVLDQSRKQLKDEMQWAKSKVGHISRQVVSHCDLLSGNIIVPSHMKELAEPVPASSPPGSDSIYNYDTNSKNDQTKNENATHYSPSTLVSFIDYEYTIPATRGFDLANHFMEWQGFDCVMELIPEPVKTNQTLRYWCFHYLSAVNHYSDKSGTQVTEHDVDQLIHELRAWWGMPGLYWGIWGAIQSSISEIDFDYATYAKSRVAEYYQWKNEIYPTLKDS